MPFTPTFVPMTELDGVNMMLMSIGQAPLNTLSSAIKDSEIARLTLHNSLREVLTKGWYFNTDEEYPIVPDGAGKINLPANALSIDPCDESQYFVERWDVAATAGRRLYDKENHTFVINQTVKVDISWFFEFEQIPQAARSYIAHYAGRIFQASQIGSELLYKFTKERELELLGELQCEQRRTSDTNMFAQNTVTGRIFQRR